MGLHPGHQAAPGLARGADPGHAHRREPPGRHAAGPGSDRAGGTAGGRRQEAALSRQRARRRGPRVRRAARAAHHHEGPLRRQGAGQDPGQGRRMKILSLPLLCLLTLAVLHPAAQAATKAHKLTVDGVTRQYLLHVPPAKAGSKSAKTRRPVVVMFHGAGGNARSAMKETGWVAKADAEGFIAVFPEGTAPDPAKPGRFVGNPQTWNDGSGRLNVGAAQAKVDDLAFMRALLDDLAKRPDVDTQRIYVTGFSNGASMSFLVA